MLLTDLEIQKTLEVVKAAFPNFTDWQYVNEVNGEYFGFSTWGKLTLGADVLMQKSFFITLDTYENEWRGALTIGQHSYLWSSADFGDAHLLGVGPCESVEDAIAALKDDIVSLFEAFVPSRDSCPE